MLGSYTRHLLPAAHAVTFRARARRVECSILLRKLARQAGQTALNHGAGGRLVGGSEYGYVGVGTTTAHP